VHLQSVQIVIMMIMAMLAFDEELIIRRWWLWSQ
jgi:hypothetical protein